MKKLHEKAIEILEGIEAFEQQKKSIKESLNGYGGTIIDLRDQYQKKIIAIDKAINKMKQKHIEIIKQLWNLY